MAADENNLDENNLKIPQLFNKNYYKTWKQYVVPLEPQTIENPKAKTLALLCILGYKFCFDGKEYENKFFRLFCRAQSSRVGSRYRKPERKKLRPRLFNKPPSYPDAAKFSFVWPVAFKALHDGRDISDTFYVGIPGQYFYTVAMEGQPESQSGSLCTMLYLVMTDVAASFRKSVPFHSVDGTAMWQVECPCLLDYFKRSPINNRNNLPALIGEYSAFLHVCFELRYHETWRFTPEERGVDFNVSNGEKTLTFSVKTNNRDTSLQLFVEGTLDPSTNAPVNPEHAMSDAAVLILNCSCSDCKLNPTVLLTPGANYLATCKRSKARQFIEMLYGTADTGQHYLMSACTYFDLRFAISTFDHRSFRGDQQFKARCEFIACFGSRVACEDWCDNSCLLWS